MRMKYTVGYLFDANGIPIRLAESVVKCDAIIEPLILAQEQKRLGYILLLANQKEDEKK